MSNEVEPSPEEMTRWRIEGYRVAQAGRAKIHTWGRGDDEVVCEVAVGPGELMIPEAVDPMPDHVDGPMYYLGVMSPEAAGAMADMLEAMLIG